MSGIIFKGFLFFFLHSLESTKSSIIPELVELANDEETFVRLAGIETVIQMLPLLDNGMCKVI